ncbi:MAG: DUF1775 domain-containing protein [Neisseriaceae bacterium]|nr:DUF1775 domain-containing protein [Neisseriaceae bacterium]
MMQMRSTLVAVLALMAASQTWAHAHFNPSHVAPGYVGPMSIQIGHGCSGQATERVTLYVPQGVSVTSMPKQGWQVNELKTAGRVSEVSWSGNQLPSNEKAEFTFGLVAPMQSGAVAMAVRQLCVNGEELYWHDEAAKSAFPVPSFNVSADAMADVVDEHDHHDHHHGHDHDHAGHDHDHDHAHAH